jgi:CHAT domain-containing protein
MGREAEAREMADSAVATALAMRVSESSSMSAAYIAQIVALSESGDTAAIAAARRALAAVDERFRTGALLIGPGVRLNLARAATVLGEPDEAWRLALEAERLSRELVQVNLSSLPDRQALLFTRDEARYMTTVTELARRSGEPARIATALDRLVRNRGMVRTEIARRRLPDGSQSDTALVALHERWIAAQRNWSRRLVRSGGVPRDSAQRAGLQRLHDEAESAETAYVTALAARGTSAPPTSVGWSEIRARLRPDEALVSCTVSSEELAWRVDRDTAHVVALVARGGSDRIQFVDFGKRARLAAAILPWRERLAMSPGVDAHRGDATEREVRRLGQTARAATWDRIAPAIGDAKDVYVVGEWPLIDMPWPALPDGKDRYLVESGVRIHLLGAERELVDSRDRPRTNSLLALGAPDFDRDAPSEGPATTQVAALVRSAADPCSDGHLPSFAPLPASGVEAESAARAWRALPQHDAVVLTGAAASEAAFRRSAQGHAVLHLATHGVVAGDRCAPGADGTRGVGGLEPVASAETPATGDSAPKASKASPRPSLISASVPPKSSPWISRRVWLALAGANRARDHEGDDDGLLTAEEVVTLDLAGTDWVVLSACHSGVADWSPDAALGMRRAFSLAGARTVIASQWAVEDASTVEWMKQLYSARAEGATSAAAAMESATRHVLAARRKDGRTTHPFYWAAFGASGE